MFPKWFAKPPDETKRRQNRFGEKRYDIESDKKMEECLPALQKQEPGRPRLLFYPSR